MPISLGALALASSRLSVAFAVAKEVGHAIREEHPKHVNDDHQQDDRPFPKSMLPESEESGVCSGKEGSSKTVVAAATLPCWQSKLQDAYPRIRNLAGFSQVHKKSVANGSLGDGLSLLL